MKYLSNPDMLLGLMRQMLSGMEVTLPLFFYTLIFSLPLGVIVALMRMCKLKIVSVPTRVCILVLRGTPLILQIFAIYFILPRLLGHPFDRMASAVVAFVINYGEGYGAGYLHRPVRYVLLCQKGHVGHRFAAAAVSGGRVLSADEHGGRGRFRPAEQAHGLLQGVRQ